MFKILLIVLGSILVGAILISYLTFFFYIRKSFIDSSVASGIDRKEAKEIWSKTKLPILKMAFRIVFRGER
jgi:pyrroline-5-carboxylate reductase